MVERNAMKTQVRDVLPTTTRMLIKPRTEDAAECKPWQFYSERNRYVGVVDAEQGTSVRQVAEALVRPDRVPPASAAGYGRPAKCRLDEGVDGTDLVLDVGDDV